MADRLAALEKIATHSLLNEGTTRAFKRRLQQLRRKSPALPGTRCPHDLKRFRGERRHWLERRVDIVYDAIGNQTAAKTLVDKILRRL